MWTFRLLAALIAALVLAPAARAVVLFAPPAPVITSPEPGAFVKAVTLTGTAATGATVAVKEGEVEVGNTKAEEDGTWTVPVPGATDGAHTYAVTATDADGTSPAASITLTVDRVAPPTTIDAGPEPFTRDSTPSFRFGSDDPDATFECRIDAALFEACPREFTSGELGDGLHTLESRAVDRAGNRDETPSSLTFTVDTAVPAAPVITQPTDGATLASVTLKGSSEASAIVRVFDGDAFLGLAQTTGESWQYAADVAEGAHTFRVTQVDRAGNESPAATVNVTVDRTGPTELTVTGATLTNAPRLTFVSESGATFTCKLDDLAGAPCTSPFTPTVVDGPHTLTVIAYDAAGNAGASTQVAFTVDTVAPAASFTSGPSGATKVAAPTFEFTAEPGATVTCQLDSATAASCSSPLTLDPQPEGPHTLRLVATDAAGNRTEVTRTFTVDTVKPIATITAGPEDGATIDGATLRFDIGFDQVDTTAVCELVSDSGTLRQSNCASFVESTLKNGHYTFTVTPTDAAGNVGDPVSRSFTVLHGGPQAVVAGGPTQPTNVTAPRFDIDGPPGSTFKCSIRDTRPVTACTRTTGYRPDPALPDGAYTFVVVAYDGNGDAGPEATRDFVVDTKAPTATVSSGPAGPVRETRFTLGASEPGRLECRVDGLLVNCDTTFVPQVVDGPHILSVVAIDAAGNRSAAVTRTFTIDTTAPVAPEITPAATGSTATFAFSSSDGTFTCRLEGPGRDGTFAPCSSPVTYSGLAPGTYRFTLRATDAAGNTTEAPSREVTLAAPLPATPTPTPVPVATPAPTATFHQTVVVRPVSGTVLVKRPGSTAFVALKASASLPLGSIVDAKAGRIQLTSQPSAGKAVQKAYFYGGSFQITQPGTMIELRLVEELTSCTKPVAGKPKSRQLWGDGKGSFRIRGRYSTATVRGTTWLVQDTCAGTLDPGEGRCRRRPRQRGPQDRPPARREELHRQGEALTLR